MKEELISLAKEKGFMAILLRPIPYKEGTRWHSLESIRYYVWMCELQKWLREKHKIYVTPHREEIGTDEWDYSYEIEYLPKDKEMAKRRCPEFIIIYSYKEYGGTYTGAWGTYEEALEEGLKEGLKLIE